MDATKFPHPSVRAVNDNKSGPHSTGPANPLAVTAPMALVLMTIVAAMANVAIPSATTYATTAIPSQSEGGEEPAARDQAKVEVHAEAEEGGEPEDEKK